MPRLKIVRSILIDLATVTPSIGYSSLGATTAYRPDLGYGWIIPPKRSFWRTGPDALLSTGVQGDAPARLKIDAPPGLYKVRLTMADAQWSLHRLKVTMPGLVEPLPLITADTGEAASLTFTASVEENGLEIEFSSPTGDWALNTIEIHAAESTAAPIISRWLFDSKGRWQDVFAIDDAIRPYLARFRGATEALPPPAESGFITDDYLGPIESCVDFFLKHQTPAGAIIDPYRREEFQYSTPCFAFAAALVAEHRGRQDLIEPAAKALDLATASLVARTAASDHEDFYSPPIALAIRLLSHRVAETRSAKWRERIRRVIPVETYRQLPGWGNWNVVATCGEYLFYKQGLRLSNIFVENSLAGQGHYWRHPFGLYVEDSFVYDHFPRFWAGLLLFEGYDGRYAHRLVEVVRRGAITSLFMQSPTGDFPPGGRSSHHIWNETQQCATFEMAASRAMRAGDAWLAGVFRRASALSFEAVLRWRRMTGEFSVLKNRVDPAAAHGFEYYTSHSQYNLLAALQLGVAYQTATQRDAEAVTASYPSIVERFTPAELGGYVMEINPFFSTLFANADGVQAVINLGADSKFNATGLNRIHWFGAHPHIGPNDSLTATPGFRLPDGVRCSAAVGPAWRTPEGDWRALAELKRDEISEVAVAVVEQSLDRVEFSITWRGEMRGPSEVIERFCIANGQLRIDFEFVDYDEELRLVWPVLVSDGSVESYFVYSGEGFTAHRTEGGAYYETPGCATLHIDAERYAHRNGWISLAIADFRRGVAPTLIVGRTSGG